MGKIKDWLKYNSKLHLVDSTSMVAIGTPISAAMEVGIAGMSDDVSFNARLIAAGLAYGGMGSLFSRGRDLWRKGFGVTNQTKEKIQGMHDIAYFTSVNLAFSPLFYYASGSRDLKEITYGTLAAVALNISLGWPAGFTIDTMRALAGIKESERLPTKVKNLNSKTKKSLVALAIVGSLAITGGIYGLTKDEVVKEKLLIPEKLEQTQEISYSPRNLESNLI